VITNNFNVKIHFLNSHNFGKKILYIGTGVVHNNIMSPRFINIVLTIMFYRSMNDVVFTRIDFTIQKIIATQLVVHLSFTRSCVIVFMDSGIEKYVLYWNIHHIYETEIWENNGKILNKYILTVTFMVGTFINFLTMGNAYLYRWHTS